MATKTVTGTLKRSDNTAVAGALVTAQLSAQAVISGTLEIAPSYISTTTAADGTWSLTLQANGDLTPNTLNYAISVGPAFYCTAIVPQTAGPFEISNIMAPPPPLGPAWDATLVHLAGSETLTGAKRSTQLVVLDKLPGDATTSTPTDVSTGKVWDWGGYVFHIKAGGAKGLSGGATDDTAKINPVIAAAIAVSSGDDCFGAVVYASHDTYPVTALTYAGGRWTLRGSGKHSTIFRQVTSNATPIISATGSGYPYKQVIFEDFGLEGWYTNAVAGINLEGSANSVVRRVFFDGIAPGYSLRVKGNGIASSSDAMYCTAEDCEFNPQAGAHICIQLSNGASGGSHPDGFRAFNNYVNGAAGTTFFQIDVAGTGAGWFSGDAPIVAFNNIQGAGVPWDVNTQGGLFIGNRCEVTSGTMTVYVRPGPANWPSLGNTFIANVYATYGDPTKFTFSDTADPLTATWRIADGPPGDGSSSARNYFRLPMNAIYALTYSAAMTPNPGLAEINQIVATNGTAFTINNPQERAKGRRVTIDLKNSSGGALGAVTLGAAYLLAGALVAPANTKRRLYSFYDDGTNLVELFRSAADI